MKFVNLRGTLFKIAAAVLGGVTSSLAFPRENISPLIFLSVMLLVASIRNSKALPALGIGFVGGMAFYLSQIEWLSLYLGPVPWLALSILEAAIFAIGLMTIAIVWRWLEAKITNSNKFKNLIVAGAIATLWTAREWISISIPYGGFPWSRLAQTQSQTYLAKWVYVGGLGLLTFVIALVSAIALIWILKYRSHRMLPDIAATLAVIIVLLIPAILQPSASAEAGSITIGAVQGNANAGLFANETPGTILQNHLAATKLLQAKSNFQDLDVVVWPENASDLSPFSSATASQAIKKLVNDEIKVPLIFGTITQRGDELFNSSILWKPGTGPTDYYDKKRPVPFAEYVPDRDFWYQLAPDLIGLVSRGYTFGTRDGIFEVRDAKLGALICFEIAVDDIGRGLVNDGAQIIISQTNNADFGHSDETYQQAAFARLRAIETGRVVVNVSTVGVSAIYSPDGSVIDQVPSFEPAAMLDKLPLRKSITPAMVIGPVFDLLINFAAALLLAISFYRSAWPPARRARM
jgi:apolipoprotein N-acyltransferase